MEKTCKLRPNWQLATACFLVSNGADLNIKDRKGVSVVEMCEESSLRPIIVHMAQTKQRTGMPMLALSQDKFDAAEVTMCSFLCIDSVATVKLTPCGHRVACVDCAEKTAIRRCPVCYQFIAGAEDQSGKAIQIGSRCSEASEIERKTTEVSPELYKKIAEDAVREAKITMEKEKQKELNLLKQKLEQLELETSCAICMDSKIAIVFNCGHTACAGCTQKLNKQCHICRKTIETTQCIYS
ncbi:unnamed protein product [Caenorhabditis sp. 36 PRJEB53466]|nr:unnamed protein product [Caenorhabditis sp. 36 PRJEB53466]